jgi:transcriptional regulator with XRE-family HTH domain
MRRETILKNFGGNVRRARMKKGLTQEELAERAGLDFRQIGFIERGELNPKLRTILKIYKGLDCPVTRLFPER